MVMVRVSFLFHYFIVYWLIKFLSLVEFDEFVKVMRHVYERRFTDDEMRRAFKCFDTDNSGKSVNVEY